MMRDKDLFISHLVDSFCALQSDSIVNVRLELSLCLKNTAAICGDIPKIQKTVTRLKFDSNKDISFAVKELVGEQ